MSGTKLRGLMLGFATVGLLGVVSGTAKAAHVDYCFTGECLGFEAETHMVSSLELMEKAFQTRRIPYYTRSFTYRAIRELRYASRELSSRRAASYVDLALDDLRTFVLTGRISELDHAAKHVNDAIRAEQRYHRRHAHHDHHDHHGYRDVRLAPVRHPNPWAQQGWNGRVGYRSSGMQVGGNWGAIRIRF